jgi:hypothetical protein
MPESAKPQVILFATSFSRYKKRLNELAITHSHDGLTPGV